jgi:hypothetical protein
MGTVDEGEQILYYIHLLPRSLRFPPSLRVEHIRYFYSVPFFFFPIAFLLGGGRNLIGIFNYKF